MKSELCTPLWETIPISLENWLAPISKFEFGCDVFFGLRKSAFSASVACPQIVPLL
jgi:hypothetical protein